MNDKKSSLGGYMSGSPYPSPQKKELPQLVPTKEPYKGIVGFGAGDKGERFRLVQKNGDLSFYAYGHLLEGTLKGEMLTLSMTSRSVIISGKNLIQLVDALSNRKVKAVHVFNAETHLMEDDGKSPFIERIEIEGESVP